jgi:hypothetical protein
MDNSNNLSSSIIKSMESSNPSPSISGSVSNTPVFSSSDNTSSSFIDNIKSLSITTWLLIIIILAFLGFNIFVYLAKGTQNVTNVFEPLFKKIFGTTAALTGQTIDVAAEGAKSVVSTTSGAVTTGLSTVQNVTPNLPNSNIKTAPVTQTTQQPDSSANNSLNKALNTSQQQQTTQNSDYEPHEASSSVNLASKSGWCFIGEDRGYRSCAQVSPDDQCMSGDIFPTQEICVNPSLRA